MADGRCLVDAGEDVVQRLLLCEGAHLRVGPRAPVPVRVSVVLEVPGRGHAPQPTQLPRAVQGHPAGPLGAQVAPQRVDKVEVLGAMPGRGLGSRGERAHSYYHGTAPTLNKHRRRLAVYPPGMVTARAD